MNGISFSDRFYGISNSKFVGTTNGTAIYLDECNDSKIYGNLIENNLIGMKLVGCFDNLIYRNLFSDNNIQVETNGDDTWFRRPPVGGNYWSDYIGNDKYKGPNQDQPGSDGIGDTPYIISASAQDNYPIFIDKIPPHANAGEDISINIGEIYHFDGTNSYDESGCPMSYMDYNWSFLYDNKLFYVEGYRTEYEFIIPGIYNVTLQLTDFFGNKGFDNIIITVIDTINPSPRINGSLVVPEGEILRLHGLDSIDNGKIVKWIWSFFCNDQNIEIEGPYLNYSFDNNYGRYSIHLQVFDLENNSGSNSWTVVVLDSTPPIADGGEDIEKEEASILPVLAIVIIILLITIAIVGYVFISNRKNSDNIILKGEEPNLKLPARSLSENGFKSAPRLGGNISNQLGPGEPDQ